MARGQKAVPIDEYTYGLLQQIVGQGKASNLADAILKSASAYLGIRYKSREERKMEQDLSTVLELGKKATKEE